MQLQQVMLMLWWGGGGGGTGASTVYHLLTVHRLLIGLQAANITKVLDTSRTADLEQTCAHRWHRPPARSCVR